VTCSNHVGLRFEHFLPQLYLNCPIDNHPPREWLQRLRRKISYKNLECRWWKKRRAVRAIPSPLSRP
jgi:hypothetical protein